MVRLLALIKVISDMTNISKAASVGDNGSGSWMFEHQTAGSLRG